MAIWTETHCVIWLTATASLLATPRHSLLLTASTPCRTHTSPREGGYQIQTDGIYLRNVVIWYVDVKC